MEPLLLLANFSSNYTSNVSFEYEPQDVLTFEEFGWISTSIVTVYLFFLSLVGCGLNIVLVIVFSRKKELRTPINWLFMNLTIGDLTVGIGPTTVAFGHSASHTVMADWVCSAYGFLAFFGGRFSIKYDCLNNANVFWNHTHAWHSA